MPRGSWNKKDERQYKAILKSCTKSKKVCQRIAAAVVNKRRASEGRTATHGGLRVGKKTRRSVVCVLVKVPGLGVREVCFHRKSGRISSNRRGR